jgi:hypothetical protein
MVGLETHGCEQGKSPGLVWTGRQWLMTSVRRATTKTEVG